MAYCVAKELDLPTDVNNIIISFLGNVHAEKRARFWKSVCINDLIDAVELYEDCVEREDDPHWDGYYIPNDVDVIRYQNPYKVRNSITDKFRPCLEEIDPNYTRYFDRETECINIHSYMWGLHEALKSSCLKHLDPYDLWLR